MSALRGLRNSEPSPSSDMGVRESNPAWTESSRASSATVRAMGPFTPMLGSQSSRVWFGTRPMLVRKPSTLFQPAGLRRLPP